MNRKGHKPPRTAEWILRRLRNSVEDYSLLGDMEEEYARILNQKGKARALAWYWKQIWISFFPFLRNSVVWSGTMLKNYLKITFRNFNKHRGYSFITLSGLALGMACCLLILLYIQHELSYDRFFAGSDRIYRIIMDAKVGSTKLKTPITSCPIAPTLAQDYPEVEAATRIRKISKVLAKYADREFYETGALWADGSFFDVFSFPFIRGDSKQALLRANTVVLTESTARKYFGSIDPVGKMLHLDSQRDFEVTGIIKDPPSNSHLNFDLLVSFETVLEDQPRIRSDWISGHYFTYVKMNENTDPAELENKFPAMIDNHVGKQLKAWEASMLLFLQPVTDIHLHSHYQFEFAPNSSILYIYIFSAIALFILVIACINFMNLATARSSKRAREVGLRKVLGAERSSLIKQFLGESMVFSLISLLGAIALVQAARPFFKSISGIDLQITSSQMLWLIPLFIGLMLFTGITAGSYPAFFLSAFQPVKVLKGIRLSGSRSIHFRHILVIVQFVVSITLIIGTLVIRSQVKYMKNKDLGFSKEQVLVSEVDSREVFRDLDTVKARLQQIPGVIKVAGADAVPGQGSTATTIGVIPEGFSNEEGLLMKAIRADEDYLDVLGIELASGRNFSRDMSTDKQGALLMNRAALKTIGWESPLGRTLSLNGIGQRNSEHPVIGVVKDFHYASLREEIEPILIAAGMGGLDKLVFRVQTDNIAGLIAQLKDAWKEIDPAHPFDFFFLDEFFDAQYRAEERLNSIIAWFSGLAILIACLGLFGLSSFMAEQRTKEIGIRKVLGASTSSVVALLSRELLMLVGTAVLIAWPVGYAALTLWLRNFSFRIGLDPLIFLASGLAALAIAFLTISYQAVKAASANPAAKLRYE